MTKPSPNKGFTILEIIITLSVIALFIGASASFLHTKSSSELSEFNSELQNFIRDTKLSAEREQSLYLHFSQDKIRRSRLAEIDKSTAIQHEIKIPAELKIAVKSDLVWQKVEKSFNHQWLFSRSGLVEPLSIRLSMNKSEFELDFNELTALPEDLSK